MESFVAGVIMKMMADPKFQEDAKKILTDPQVWKAVEDLFGKLITERILPLVPIAVGAAVKAAIENVPGIGKSVIVDIAHTTNGAFNALGDFIPGFGMPLLKDVMDFWMPKQD